MGDQPQKRNLMGDLMIIYIVENSFHCVYKNRIISVDLKNCIQKGYIVNKEVFMQEFNKMLKKEKIKTKLFGDNITFVNNGYFSTGDLFFLESIFNDLGFIKVDFLDIRDLFPDMNVIFVEINESYIIIYLKDTLYLDLTYFKDIPVILNSLKTAFDKDIAFFGLNKSIPNIHIKNVYSYYIENYKNYITQSLLKVKKQGYYFFFLLILLFFYTIIVCDSLK